jgi:hypothetical protein
MGTKANALAKESAVDRMGTKANALASALFFFFFFFFFFSATDFLILSPWQSMNGGLLDLHTAS